MWRSDSVEQVLDRFPWRDSNFELWRPGDKQVGFIDAKGGKYIDCIPKLADCFPYVMDELARQKLLVNLSSCKCRIITDVILDCSVVHLSSLFFLARPTLQTWCDKEATRSSGRFMRRDKKGRWSRLLKQSIQAT